MNKVKITREWENGKVETGYMNDKNEFILHSFDDKPGYIDDSGYKVWYKDGSWHRDGDLPAYEWWDGCKKWYSNGVKHREGGKPAVIRPDGTVEYWFEGKRYYPEQKLPEYTLKQLKEKIGHDFKLIIDVK